jgi:ADP-heptose:LPS heptosyltransferase
MRPQFWVVDFVSDYTNVYPIRTDGKPGDLYAAIQACDAVVTVDTSIAHIAVALGKPLLDIFCRAAQARINFQPVGERVRVVESTSPVRISEVEPVELVSTLRFLLEPS